MPARQRTSKRRFLGSKQGVLFLVFAAVIWTLSALSETYITTVPVQFKLQADSSACVFSNTHIEVPAQVSSTGFSILYRRIFPRKVALMISELPIKEAENPTLNSDYLLNKYKQTYSNSSEINGFVPAVISLPMTQAVQKSYSPKLAALPKFEEGYQLISPLRFSLDSVSAFGSKAILEKLDQAIFKLPAENPIRENFTLEATLLDSIANLANWDTTIVQVSGKVDRYSDVTFVLPITLIDTPENVLVSLSPRQVKIKFAAPLSSLRSIDETKLLAEAVFEKTSSGQLSVYVTGLPKTAKKLTISPPTVSYLTVE